MAVAAIDGRPLGPGRVTYITQDLTLQTSTLHTEKIRLFVIKSPHHPIILGLPWLEKHNLDISWTDRQITQWSHNCQQQCLKSLTRTSPLATNRIEPNHLGLPVEYQDLTNRF